MKHRSRLREEEESEQHREQEVQAGQTVKDFGSVEELLRYDRERTEVPDGLGKRIREAAGKRTGQSR